MPNLYHRSHDETRRREERQGFHARRAYVGRRQAQAAYRDGEAPSA
jgi:hypothetical protein